MTVPSLDAVARRGARDIGYAVYGDPDGHRVVWHHPTPSSRLAFAGGGADLLAEAGIALVSVERSGYGASTPDPERTPRSAADDATAVLDALGWDEVASVGYSGGGPYALALAAAPERVTGVAVLAGIGPRASTKDIAALDPVTRRIHAIDSAADADALIRDLPGTGHDAYLAAVLDGITDPDQRALATRIVGEIFRHGTAGIAQDLLAANLDWGFDLGEVACPVDLVYGSTDDRVPPAVGEWLRDRLPDARLRVVECGHDFTSEQRVAVIAGAAAP